MVKHSYPSAFLLLVLFRPLKTVTQLAIRVHQHENSFAFFQTIILISNSSIFSSIQAINTKNGAEGSFHHLQLRFLDCSDASD